MSGELMKEIKQAFLNHFELDETLPPQKIPLMSGLAASSVEAGFDDFSTAEMTKYHIKWVLEHDMPVAPDFLRKEDHKDVMRYAQSRMLKNIHMSLYQGVYIFVLHIQRAITEGDSLKASTLTHDLLRFCSGDLPEAYDLKGDARCRNPMC